MKRVLVSFIAGLLVACGSQVEALSSADAARISALEATTAQLQSQLGALQASLTSVQATVGTLSSAPRPAVFLQAPRASNVQGLRKASISSDTAPSTCTGLGTLTGRPDSSNPISSNLLAGVSCTGYVYVITGAASATDQALVQPLKTGALLYASADCSGAALVSPNFTGQAGAISPNAFVSGAVFTLGGDPSAAASYFAIPAAAQGTSVVVNSYVDPTDQNATCRPLPGYTLTNSVQLVPNDSAITGVPAGPITGPITLGTAG